MPELNERVATLEQHVQNLYYKHRDLEKLIKDEFKEMKGLLENHVTKDRFRLVELIALGLCRIDPCGSGFCHSIQYI